MYLTFLESDQEFRRDPDGTLKVTKFRLESVWQVISPPCINVTFFLFLQNDHKSSVGIFHAAAERNWRQFFFIFLQWWYILPFFLGKGKIKKRFHQFQKERGRRGEGVPFSHILLFFSYLLQSHLNCDRRRERKERKTLFLCVCAKKNLPFPRTWFPPSSFTRERERETKNKKEMTSFLSKMIWSIIGEKKCPNFNTNFSRIFLEKILAGVDLVVEVVLNFFFFLKNFLDEERSHDGLGSKNMVPNLNFKRSAWFSASQQTVDPW